MNITAYARSSEGDSSAIDDQLNAIRQWALENGYFIIGEHYDMAFTHQQRPGWEAAIKTVEEGKADEIIVTSLDRAERDSVKHDALKLRGIPVTEVTV
jgi:DNA invertase Pin-like site-specific DNA recombinase